ncbi:MAG: hypothetical protein LLF83_11445 [Methanobacterium sp.]|nr:hypothetical protein [Methanobacterium sp.]
MSDYNIKYSEVLGKLKTLESNETEDLVWVSFPYSEQNLEFIKFATKRIFKNDQDYRLTFDADIIFVQRG